MPRLRVGVLSAGAWSQSSHLPAVRARDDAELVVVTSQSAETARRLAEQFGASNHLTRWQDALELGLDCVVVSSPPVAHVEQVCAALRSGAHVLVEKPFAMSTADADTMVRAAEESGCHLLVGFGWAATPVFAAARRAVAEGRVGRIEHASMTLAVSTRALLGGSTDGGWGGVASCPATYTDPAVSAGGSAAVSMSHQLGLLLWILGDDVEIGPMSATSYPAGARIDLHNGVLLPLSGGGAAVLSCASTRPYSTRPQWVLSLYGDRGDLHLDSMADQVRLVDDAGRVCLLADAAGAGAYDPFAPTHALLDAALGAPVHPGMSGHLARRVVALTDEYYARTVPEVSL
ncbi:Predicted dehydrogenase [Pseudonocardia thermophila]|uniref:Predicted dehydrogenase n=1 Tax=Pseudonocardia thermophila TaxID=1848 RepID=A0A1M6WQ88_PSETH|nr:Gfo/Idh/MocA family oxidoreductase [Pseudonocardia thermophila]SHK95685.1 Predicted dehydrogenase [Pseudonocardia thermophila]